MIFLWEMIFMKTIITTLIRNGFKAEQRLRFDHHSQFSMGNDAADFNNDGWPDIVNVDMLPEDEKVLTVFAWIWISIPVFTVTPCN